MGSMLLYAGAIGVVGGLGAALTLALGATPPVASIRTVIVCAPPGTPVGVTVPTPLPDCAVAV